MLTCDIPQTKSQIMTEAIKNCKHLLEIDYLRGDPRKSFKILKIR